MNIGTKILNKILAHQIQPYCFSKKDIEFCLVVCCLTNCCLDEKKLWLVAFANFHGVNIFPPWQISSYPCEATNHRAGKRCTNSSHEPGEAGFTTHVSEFGLYHKENGEHLKFLSRNRFVTYNDSDWGMDWRWTRLELEWPLSELLISVTKRWWWLKPHGSWDGESGHFKNVFKMLALWGVKLIEGYEAKTEEPHSPARKVLRVIFDKQGHTELLIMEKFSFSGIPQFHDSERLLSYRTAWYFLNFHPEQSTRLSYSFSEFPL